MHPKSAHQKFRRPSRRDWLRTVAATPLAASVAATAHAGPSSPSYGKIYQRLGLTTVINAKGFYTSIGGSIMPREVREAMEDAAHHFVRIDELQQKVGQRLAELTGAESALVTAGASAAITVGTAGCMTGKDPEKIKRLPQTSGMKDQVIIQKNHRNAFDHAVRAAGPELIEVTTRQEYQNAFNERTAMVYHLVADRHFGPRQPGKIPLRDAIAVAHEHNVPYLVDAAAEVPPVENLSYFTRQGADLVCFSGGKGLMGPQCSGMLVGRRDLVEAAWLNHMAGSDTIGRAMKVGKEEIAGLLAAVERFVKLDHRRVEQEWKDRLERIAEHWKDLDFVEARPLPDDIEPPHVPRMYVKWNEQDLGLTTEQAIQALIEGDPPIYVNHSYYGLTIVPALLRPSEERIVGRRLREVLFAAARNAGRA